MNGQAAQRLPVDLVALIASHVSGVDVIRMCAVCRAWSQLQASAHYEKALRPALLALAEFFTETHTFASRGVRKHTNAKGEGQKIIDALARLKAVAIRDHSLLRVFAGRYDGRTLLSRRVCREYKPGQYEDVWESYGDQYSLEISPVGNYTLRSFGFPKEGKPKYKSKDKDSEIEKRMNYEETGWCSAHYSHASLSFVLCMVPEKFKGTALSGDPRRVELRSEDSERRRRMEEQVVAKFDKRALGLGEGRACGRSTKQFDSDDTTSDSVAAESTSNSGEDKCVYGEVSHYLIISMRLRVQDGKVTLKKGYNRFSIADLELDIENEMKSELTARKEGRSGGSSRTCIIS